MYSKMSSSVAPSVRKRPRITVKAMEALRAKLDPASRKNWRLVASDLDQRKFTNEWIELMESKCPNPSFSPTVEVLREWQRGLTIDQDVPVQQLFAVLKDLGREDAASLVVKMSEDQTFLDYYDEPIMTSPQSTCNPSHQGQLSPDLRCYKNSSQYPSMASCCRNHSQQQPHPSPQESSYHGWPDHSASTRADRQRQPCSPGLPEDPHNLQVLQPRSNRQPDMQVEAEFNPDFGAQGPNYEQTPMNFNRSQISLISDRSSSLHMNGLQLNPNPHRLTDSDPRNAFSTWPPRSAGRSSRSNICIRENEHFAPIQSNESGPEYLLQGPGFLGHTCSSIQPLRSVSPVNTTETGASPIQVQDSYRNNCWFITYPYTSFKRAFQLGMALKTAGQNVIVDRKIDSFMSATHSREETSRLYKTATHIIIICNKDYIKEIGGRVKSPLNTRFIYGLMETEFRQRQRNIRFVPIIDQEHIRDRNVPEPFRSYSKEYQAFVFKALCNYNTAKSTSARSREVSIERTFYGSH
ncbi:uncharacterized protein LOC110987348 [Acanthaster planci]|uniref:Uncharacterized protein LOC110987348 n=1 Tax=Acanthaster planci TaxID=133434 RepID=A0A8B7ZJ93_ACAPL|nr:uncharacterized protein LOC110987348 [Acanthaster planci]XP_022105703.1 uncharacterized protein LOC110987348 [Acanthaster planci]